jgi:hypothetical protein
VPPGPVTLTAELRRGHTKVTKVVVAPASGVTLHDGPLPRVSGTVLQADGRPARRFSVNGRDVTNAAGRFELALFETDRLLVVRAPGHAPSLLQAPDVGGDVGRVALRLGQVLGGRVTDARDGAPVVGVRVELLAAQGLELDEVRTDSDGWFEFAQAPEAGLGVEVSVSKFDTAVRGFQPARVPRPTSSEALELRLVPAEAR